MIADLRARGVRWDEFTEEEKVCHAAWWQTVRWIEILKIREGYDVG